MANVIQGQPSKNKVALKGKFGLCEPGNHAPAWPFVLQCSACKVFYCRRHPHTCTEQEGRN